MGRIRVLSDTVADQIAAGEVVERPASVVKELVENSLDAGSYTIAVELEDGGRALIRVSDDGVGMDREDAVLALDRHATSKISSTTDLIGVATYGFRGEALPSVASVSLLELESAAASSEATAAGEGTKVVSRGGRIEKVEPVARNQGTTVTVKRLFFNTPARRKFLKSQRSETRAAVQALTVLALARLDVSFSLVSDSRTLLTAPRVSAVADRVAALFGRQLAAQLLPVDYANGPISIRGFVQRPAEAKSSGRKAHLFVNGRPFRDPFLIRAAENGYRATIPAGVRPTLFLAIGIPGDRVDVNVHPAKLEVRFRDKMFIERAVEEAVRDALRPLEAAVRMVGLDRDAAGTDDRQFVGSVPDQRSGFPGRREDAGTYGTLGLALDGPPASVAAYGRKFLQVFDTYILFETPAGIAIVDQHSAHERVLYERAMAELKAGGGAAQRLLLPLTVDLEPPELEAVEQNQEQLNAIGFEVEGFGGQSVVIHAVPNPHPRFDARRCFEELVADLAHGRLEGLNRLERFAATYACRAAIKAGQTLDHGEVRDLLHRLLACELPPHDVHGRPSIVQLPLSELERRFGRA
jgi:DNA mismatch repair protein MutL